jgi:hypothetical protein
LIVVDGVMVVMDVVGRATNQSRRHRSLAAFGR